LSEKTSMLLTDLPSAGADAARALGVRDAVHVNALDPNGRGVLLAWAIAAPTRLAPAQRRRLAMIAAHVAGARRLLLSGRSNAGPVAVFERSGVAVHVDPAHEASVPTLQERLLRMEALREGRSTTDPTEVLASWQALHAGRYSLVGRFDADGRRYMVAYENAPQVRDPRGLSPLEASVASLASHGHAQKYIGYELGLAPGTVGGILTRVYRKLRVESRSELVDRMTLPVSVTRGRASFGVEAAEHAAEVLVFALRQELDAPGLTQERPDLTQAERDVALAAARGASNDAIAGARNTSRRTVEEQLGRAMRKLGVGSRAELTARLRAIDAPGTPGTPGTPATPVRRRTQAKPG
jgi:DNA-binding NarL/FixJ family response regulator